MKHIFTLLFLMAGLAVVSHGFAHEGHEHATQLDQASAVEAAELKVQELISEGGIASKWAEQPSPSVQLARINGIQNWIVTYIDEGALERLELAFSMTGDYLSVTVMPVSQTAAN